MKYLKKKNKENIVIKTKKRILRETKFSEKKYITTYKDVKKYFKVFNKALFNGKLNPFNDVVIKNINQASGLCVGNYSFRKGTCFFTLEVMPKYTNKKEFLNTLAHEMIHLWQQTIKKDTGNHNSLFFSYGSKFKRIGLKLSY